MSIKAVYFDFDNTLYDYDGCHRTAIAAVHDYCALQFGMTREAAAEQIETARRELMADMGWRSAASHSRVIRFRRFLVSQGLPVFPYTTLLTDLYWNTFLAEMQPEEGIVPFLLALKRKGYFVAAATNMTTLDQYRKADRIGIGRFLEDMITSEEAGTEKPDPAFFAYVCRAHGYAPEECAFIGDNYRLDYLGAEAAGMHGILYCTPKLEAAGYRPGEECRMITDYREIEKNLALLKNLEK